MNKIAILPLKEKRYYDLKNYDGEEWNPVVDFEGLYEVSNIGRMKSVERYVNSFYGMKRKVKSRILKLQIDQFGYYVINIIKDNKKYHKRVHRLVLMAFVPNPENKPTGNHKDGIKLNNHLPNLEWATYKENVVHYHTKLRKYSYTREDIMKDYNLLKSTRKVAELYDIKKTRVAVIVREEINKLKSATSKLGGKQ